ncbi:hypothetical protein MH216_11475 [Paenibacillus larvae]|uniref:hypothetical protein n=1 Tax=Paenibacillus larvae TaxID=1464 RepID=UPI00228300FB|nr:hypothetical protein [Paenibacillus larvae]MCY7520457.1 hypothetical protein [Paenibacillus larvae]MCY9679943.1 hypothetical protein [Paenibacillus larvae]MCY9752290.1 hypothetical protein [Paenibacillus larvae]MEC0087004.1 hypothetical protein [Paenibacillus larvae]MEC0187309.1 hypothetical protein [Paenibacillus larvae]
MKNKNKQNRKAFADTEFASEAGANTTAADTEFASEAGANRTSADTEFANEVTSKQNRCGH